MSGTGRTAPNDAYEADHMPAQGKVMYRSKQVSRLMALLPLFFALVFVVAGGVFASGVVPAIPQLVSLLPFGLGGMLAFLGLTASGLRTVLTTEELRVQLGLWGPRIPLDAIRSCEVIDYDVQKFGGYGLKIRNGVRIYSMPGSHQAVALRYTNDSGKEERAVITAEDPVALAGKIQQARQLRIDTAGPKRIAVDDEALAEPAALAEEHPLLAERQAAERGTDAD